MEGGETVEEVFIDNKWWDALVSAWPSEPDDRHAAESHVTALLIRAPHERAHRATEGRRRRRKEEGHKRRGREGGGWVPSALFQLSCIQTRFFHSFGGRARLPFFRR